MKLNESKLCIECKWFEMREREEEHVCGHRLSVKHRSLVTGNLLVSTCEDMRKWDSHGYDCGPEAKLWEERETITECSLCQGTGKYFEWHTGNEPVTTFCPICNKNWCRIPKPKTQ